MDLIPITRALHAFTWFFGQSLNVGGLGYHFFWVPFLVLVCWTYDHLENVIGRSSPALDTSDPSCVVDFDGVARRILLGRLGTRAGSIFSLVGPSRVKLQHTFFSSDRLGKYHFLKGARWFASICFVINLYFMIAMTFLSEMAVTGDWL